MGVELGYTTAHTDLITQFISNVQNHTSTKAKFVRDLAKLDILHIRILLKLSVSPITVKLH